MLKKSFGKRMTGGIVSAAMLGSAVLSAFPSSLLTASAGQMLGQTDFENGIGLPWHTCVTQPAELQFTISGGTYNITIVNNGGEDVGGASRWDCQFRHRKLSIHAGETYRVHAEVTSDHDGMIYTKIGDLSGSKEIWHNDMGQNGKDFNQSWDPIPMTANQTLEIDAEFTSSEELETAEWAFHFGGAGEHQATDCFPDGTKLTFDNMSLECTTSSEYDWVEPEPQPEYPIHGNQLGYYTNLTKQATIHDSASFEGKAVSIVEKDSGTEVWSGTSTASGSTIDEASGMYCGTINFTDLKTPGEYYFTVDGKQASYPFKIGDDIYDDIVTDAVNYFYQNRAGVPIEEQYITSQGENASKSDLAHSQFGHQPDEAYLQDKWIKAYKNDGSDVQTSNGQITASDGWYDAGDHGKYVVNGGISVWTLQNLYEWSLADNATDVGKFADGSGTVVVPETGNSIPDILDETKVELKFFEEMLVPASYKMSVYEGPEGGEDTGVYENMIFHKLHDSKWTGLAVHAWDYEESKDWAGIKRIVKPPSTAATLNVTASAAQAARLFEDSDPTFAADMLDLAKKTYEAAKKNPKLYAPLDQAIGGGAYGDNEVSDDFYWAACELYITTGDATYLTDLESYKDAYTLTTTLSGGENNSTFTSFNWGNTAGLGTLSLYLNQDKIDPANATKIEESIAAAADAYLNREAVEGFGVPYTSSDFQDPINIPKDENGNDVTVHGYEWGSNSMVVNNAIVLAYAYNATDDAKYLNGAAEAMDYIFGRNALDYSFVTGYGTYHCVNPHHRLWSHEDDPNFPYAPSGVMSGGPNSGLQDPYVAGMGYVRGKVAPQLCYIDSIEAWSVNEVTINWNSPFAWIMSFLEDEAPSGESVDPVPGTTTTKDPSATTTTTTTTTAAGDSESSTTTTTTTTTAAAGSDTTTTTAAAGSSTTTTSTTVSTQGTGDTAPTPTATTPSGSATTTTTASQNTGASGDTSTSTTSTTTSTTVQSGNDTTPPAGTVDWGNVDESTGADRVTIADAILLARTLSNDAYRTATDQGKLNADVSHNGAVDQDDLTKLMQYLAETLSLSDLAQ